MMSMIISNYMSVTATVLAEMGNIYLTRQIYFSGNKYLVLFFSECLSRLAFQSLPLWQLTPILRNSFYALECGVTGSGILIS